MSSSLHPDGKLNPHVTVTNDTDNANILDLIEQRKLSRRGFLKGSLGATTMAVLGTSVLDGLTNYAKAAPAPLGGIGFTALPPNLYISSANDAVTVPPGYTARTLVAWGDSLSNAPHWNPAEPMTEAKQLHCYGSHTDGMHFFPFPQAGASGQGNVRGLLVTNSEYCDPPLVNNVVPGGPP